MKWFFGAILCLTTGLLFGYMFKKLETGIEIRIEDIFRIENMVVRFLGISEINLPIIGLTLALEWIISAFIRNLKNIILFFMTAYGLYLCFDLYKLQFKSESLF